MLYRKNVPNWERAVRVLVSLGLIAYGLIGASALLLKVGAVIGALVLLVTGMVGYCPMCALVGRSMSKRSSNTP